MNQKGFISTTILVIIAIVVATAGVFIIKSKVVVAPTQSPTPTATPAESTVFCTQDAKLCPDGSYVGRTGPKCEFRPCPTIIPKLNSGVTGTVLIGPSCPVQKVDDPSCDDKPYQFGEFIVRNFDASGGIMLGQEVARFTTNNKGQYAISLPPGGYAIAPVAKVGINQGTQFLVTVKAGVVIEFNFTLDTGIR